MDPPLQPPLRLRPLSSKPITPKSAQKQIDTFLEDFQARSTSAQGGNSAVTVQLQKLAVALKDERAARKKGNEKQK